MEEEKYQFSAVLQLPGDAVVVKTIGAWIFYYSVSTKSIYIVTTDYHPGILKLFQDDSQHFAGLIKASQANVLDQSDANPLTPPRIDLQEQKAIKDEESVDHYKIAYSVWGLMKVRCPCCLEIVSVSSSFTPVGSSITCSSCAHVFIFQTDKTEKSFTEKALSPAEPKAKKQKGILFVEDDHNWHPLIKEEIDETFGDRVKVYAFLAGEEAISFLKENTTNIDLVISCILLPDTSGLEVFKTCRDIKPNIPFIFHTSCDYREDLAVSEADAYIVKSADTRELKDTISISLFPDEAPNDDLLKYAKKLYQLGNYSSTIEYLKQLLIKAPNSSDAHQYLSYAYFKSGQFEKAMEEYLIAAKLFGRI